MLRPIRKAAVLGAGVMGSQIAAHLANAGIQTYLLDVVSSESGDSRNHVALTGLERAKKMTPSPFFAPELSSLITVGNFEDDLGKLSEVDWIIEVVLEDLEVKRQLLTKVDKLANPNAIVSSNTSGIPIHDIAKTLSDSLKKRFLGTHFFNPPRYMKLLEVIPTQETSKEVIQSIAEFGSSALGKGIVYCKDTPNFIANRIGTFSVSYIIHFMLQQGYTIEEVDELTGPLIGRPRSATFRTLDMVGLDIFAYVLKNLQKQLSDDEMKEYFQIPAPLSNMLEKKWLGDKTGQGFYKKIKLDNGETEILTLDFETMEYRPRQKAKLGLDLAKNADTLQDKLKLISSAKDRIGAFFWKTTGVVLAYAANRIPEIADSWIEIDRAMKWGFNWELGPFELWNVLGYERCAKKLEENGFKLPPWILEKKDKTFGVPSSTPQVVKQNAGASLIDLGEKVLCLEFHSKMNTIGEDVLKLLQVAISELEARYDALVIGNEGEHFSVGANLMLVLMLAQEEEWDELEHAVKMFQSINHQIKYSKKPIVVAPFGRTLGGGCEIALHASKLCAFAETYIGLVEMGAGVIPAGGGTTEMTWRGMELLAQSRMEEGVKQVQGAFEAIAYAKVSSSALEAKKFGFLREHDAIVMNRDFLLQEAKTMVLEMVKKGYKPSTPQKLMPLGKMFLEKCESSINVLLQNKKISEYDAHLAKKLAFVMSGGSGAAPQPMTEQDFHRLEREAFLSLCGEKKTQARMQHLLKTGKPLHN